jgi:hypothetical protein
MNLRLLLGVRAVVAIAAAPGAVPHGWQWTTQYPFRQISVVASSQQADSWPAGKAIDGDTSEPEGIWQTARSRPKSAWLELRIERPRRVRGVRIFHQRNPRYYRSVDYTIACWADGAWTTVARVQANRQAGWRAHRFEPVETTKVRITITKSEYGSRMGLNEVELDLDVPVERLVDGRVWRESRPYRCGKVADPGTITFDAHLPEGTAVELSTRTAPDAGGQPGRWCAWTPSYRRSGERVISPVNEWIQFRAALYGSAGRLPVLREVRIGSPACVERVDTGTIVLPPGKPLNIAVRFGRPMNRSTPLLAELRLPGGRARALEDGALGTDQMTWRFAPVTLGPEGGVGRLLLGGAKTRDGILMMHEEIPLVVGARPVLDRLRAIAEWTMAHEQKAIFVEGYNERTLLGLHEITGEKRYLDHVRRWAHKLLEAQDPAGFWGTGYKTVYFADTGSALGLFINFYKFATPEERRNIDAALQRYFDLLLVKGDSRGKPFVRPDGSLGVGFTSYKDGKAHGDLNKPYTISTALTGAEIFAAWHYMKGDERYKQMAVRACDWLLDTMVGEKPPDPWAQPGQIPYYIDDWNPGRKDRVWVWRRWPYDTSAYCGEGFVAAWTYIDDQAFRDRLVRRLRPHVEWLLRTQNDDGSWATRGSGDQLRSHGVVNFLLWYYERAGRDPRIADALRRYVVLLLDTERSRYLKVPGNGIATSLAGRALVEIVRPGVDCYRWKDPRRASVPPSGTGQPPSEAMRSDLDQ